MKRSCQLSLFAAILSSMIAAPPPALAKHTSNSIAGAATAQKGLLRTQQISRRPRCEGEAVLPLFLHIALRPELMEPRYINIILGRANQSGNTGLFENYIWRASVPGKASYNLQAENHPAATECSASFSAHFQHSGLNRQDIIRELGQPARHFFDAAGHPADEYRFSDHTFLTVSEPANTFEVTQITVCYQGPHIAGPSSDDYAAAQTFRLQKAQRQLAFGNAGECAKILREHLQDNPQDAPTHLLLAQTLQRTCDLNGAIDEYRAAYHLSQTQGLPHVEGEAVSGLAKIGISIDSQARQLAARNSRLY